MIESKIIKVKDGTIRGILRKLAIVEGEGYKFRRRIYIKKSKNDLIDIALQYIKET